MSSEEKTLGAAILDADVDVSGVPALSVHVENELLRRIAGRDDSIKVERVRSCWAQSGPHDHFGGKCRFVCDRCGCRVGGALGHGPPCIC
jgi:hypothetical protein